jgi:hypothetical protein
MLTKLAQPESKHAKVLIAGSRKYSDYGSVGRAIGIIINTLAEQGYKEITFMQGGCKGADEHAVEFINKTEKSVFKLTGIKIRYETFMPDYNKHGSPQALHIRNQKMVDEKPAHALVFLQRGESNRGTLSVIKRLRASAIPFTPYGAVELLDNKV